MGKHSIDQSYLDLSERIKQSRRNIDKAIKEHVDLIALQLNETDPYILGWGAYVEYVSKEDIIKNDGGTTTSAITPLGQPVTMTRGIFSIAQDRFTYPRV